MKVRQLVDTWYRKASAPLTAESYQLRLTVYDAARLAALGELFPGRTISQLIGELLSAALDELEEGLPYERGDTVVEHDEQGDPIYEDVGLGARYHALTRKHAQRIKAAAEGTQESGA